MCIRVSGVKGSGFREGSSGVATSKYSMLRRYTLRCDHFGVNIAENWKTHPKLERFPKTGEIYMWLRV